MQGNVSFLAHEKQAGCLICPQELIAAGTPPSKGTAQPLQIPALPGPPGEVGKEPFLILSNSMETQLEEQEGLFFFSLTKFPSLSARRGFLPSNTFCLAFMLLSSYSCPVLRGWDENYLQPPSFLFWSSHCSFIIILLWLSNFCQPQSTS